MATPRVEIEVGDDEEGARLGRELRGGGVFVHGCALPMLSECELVIHRGGQTRGLPARVVWLDGARGAGLEVLDFGAARRDEVAALLAAATTAAPAAPVDPDDDPDDPLGDLGDEVDGDGSEGDDDDPGAAAAGGRGRRAPQLHERLRNLSIAQQLKVAQGVHAHARILLERMYGKSVWEALLRNPRLTAPEVTRIARMGALPRPQLELIVGNGAWLQIPELRRALLGNPRLTPDQIPRILRLLPRHELKLVPTQTAYSAAVREVARRMLRVD
jgi:hypothetical protein